MKEYILSKEERGAIKNLFKFYKVAKLRARTCYNADALIEVMGEEKKISGKDINIRKTLEGYVQQCKDYLDKLETVAYSPKTEGTKESKFAQLLLGYVEKFIPLAESAIERHKELEKEWLSYKQTGEIKSKPWTRSQEMIKKDKEYIEANREKASGWREKFNKEMEEMKAKIEEEKTGKKNPKFKQCSMFDFIKPIDETV